MAEKSEEKKDAAQVEVDDDVVEIEFEGETYTIPASLDDADVDAVQAFEQGRAVTFLEAFLGPIQWAKLKGRYRKAHGGKVPVSAIEPLADEIAKTLGFDSSGE